MIPGIKLTGAHTSGPAYSHDSLILPTTAEVPAVKRSHQSAGPHGKSGTESCALLVSISSVIGADVACATGLAAWVGMKGSVEPFTSEGSSVLPSALSFGARPKTPDVRKGPPPGGAALRAGAMGLASKLHVDGGDDLMGFSLTCTPWSAAMRRTPTLMKQSHLATPAPLQLARPAGCTKG